MPFTVAKRGRGTIKSPWLPRTIVLTSRGNTPSSIAMKVSNRAESNTPAIPMMRSRGNPVACHAKYVITSKGLVTIINMASGE